MTPGDYTPNLKPPHPPYFKRNSYNGTTFNNLVKGAAVGSAQLQKQRTHNGSVNKTLRREGTPGSATTEKVVELPSVNKGRMSENDNRSVPGSAGAKGNARFSLLKPPMGIVDKKRKESADGRSRAVDHNGLGSERSLSFKIG